MLPNGVHGWGMSSSKYIQLAVRNVKEFHDVNFQTRRWLKRTSGPFPLNYAPELDMSLLLDASMASFYHTQIEGSRWCIKLGRINIITEVSELSKHLAQPRDGHFNAVFHIFDYREERHNSRIVFDPTYPIIDMSSFKDCEWKQYCGNATEVFPPNAPEARGKEVDIRLFVDSDHANDQRT